MTKKGIFDQIVCTAARVCNVSAAEIMDGKRAEDVCVARSIAVFWCSAAGFSVEDLLACTDRRNHNSIDSIKDAINDSWVGKWAYHMLIHETGKQLLEFAISIGEDFDMWLPIAHIQFVTGKKFYNIPRD